FVRALDGAAVGLAYDGTALEDLPTTAVLANAIEVEAENLLREARQRAAHDELTVLPNVCQTPQDVVEATFPRAGLTAAPPPVLSIRPGSAGGARPAYRQRLTLGAV